MTTFLERGGLYVTLPTAASVVALALLVFMPNQRKIDALRSQLRSRQMLTNEAQGMAQRIQDLQEQTDLAAAYVQRWRTNLPRDNQAVLVQAEITSLAAQAGVETTQLNPSEDVELPTLVRMPLKLELQGTFAEIFDFVKRLERLPRFIWLDTLTLKTSREDGEDLECEVDLIVFRERSEESD